MPAELQTRDSERELLPEKPQEEGSGEPGQSGAVPVPADGRDARGSRVTPCVEKLSRREQEIVRRLDSELSNREIAAALFISEGTLKWHVHNIYGKLGVKNRSGAVARARARGLIQLD